MRSYFLLVHVESYERVAFNSWRWCFCLFLFYSGYNTQCKQEGHGGSEKEFDIGSYKSWTRCEISLISLSFVFGLLVFCSLVMISPSMVFVWKVVGLRVDIIASSGNDLWLYGSPWVPQNRSTFFNQECRFITNSCPARVVVVVVVVVVFFFFFFFLFFLFLFFFFSWVSLRTLFFNCSYLSSNRILSWENGFLIKYQNRKMYT
jgi:hypothetical protein